MTTVGAAYPATVFLAQAEIRLVADQTANAEAATIKADERAVSDAEDIAKSNALVDIVI